MTSYLLFRGPRPGVGSGDDTESHVALAASTAIGPASQLLFESETRSGCYVSWAWDGD